ncbi:hypothetical protein DPEC_G00177740 [Dallia pectoralis]|uniref:Uncharacterized protein n=1 Tax=Dallia pectoralis TaxID=75939 RepID=A0ACC2GFJ3_DALPE|nr:hypothetical protein DPEC_G00177740 [Dallia pectoralis]
MVMIMFFNFSSAFNTIRPLLLDRKLSVMQSSRSDVAVSNTGSLQGTVLSPFLFTLYTSDFRYSSGTCHLQKFGLVQSFVRWSEANHLLLNTSKIKELVVDFRRNKKPLTPITIQGNEVEVVKVYKYLGVHINDKLGWADNTEARYKKGQCRLFFLRRLSLEDPPSGAANASQLGMILAGNHGDKAAWQ